MVSEISGNGRQLLYAGILALFAISMFMVFGTQTFADADYGSLLKTGLSLESAKAASAALFILLPLMVYFAAVYGLKADGFHAFVASLLFSAAALNVESLFSFSPLLALALGKSYEPLSVLKAAGAVLPLGAVALLEYKKEIIPAALAAIGIVLLPFAPGAGLILLGIAAAKGIGALESSSFGDKAIVFVVFVFAFQGAYAADTTAAFAVALLMGGITYVVVSLHNVKSDDVSALSVLLVAFTMLIAVFSATYAQTNAVSSEEIAAFAAAKGISGSFGVFDYSNAFQYYSGKSATVLNASALLKKGAQLPEYVEYSGRSLSDAYSGRPLVFQYAGAATANNRQYALFSNTLYVIQAAISGSDLAVEDARLFDAKTGEGMVIPYSKMRKLFGTQFSDPQNRLLNVQELEESQLYSILFKSASAYAGNGTAIVKVQ